MTTEYIEEAPLYRHGQVRVGGCNVGCGACCLYLELPLDPRLLTNTQERLADWIHWAELHGVKVYPSGRGKDFQLVARVESKCTELTDDGRCGLYGKEERPDLCKRYPMHPLDTEGVKDRCTYVWGADEAEARERLEIKLDEVKPDVIS